MNDSSDDVWGLDVETRKKDLSRDCLEDLLDAQDQLKDLSKLA